MEAMAASLQISPDLFKRKYTRIRNKRFCLAEKKNSDCIFLEGKKCTIYEARPKQCRTYPWWPENLHSEESWKSAAKSCEGINDNAPIVPFSDIVQFTA